MLKIMWATHHSTSLLRYTDLLIEKKCRNIKFLDILNYQLTLFVHAVTIVGQQKIKIAWNISPLSQICNLFEYAICFYKITKKTYYTGKVQAV